MESNEWKKKVNSEVKTRGKRQNALLPCLQAVQKTEGYISSEAIEYISDKLNVPPVKIYSVVTFYAQFRTEPVGRYIITICRGTTCHVRGSGRILAEVKKDLGLEVGKTDENRHFTLDTVACFGSCALAPVIVIEDTKTGKRQVHGKMTIHKMKDILNALKEEFINSEEKEKIIVKKGGKL